MKVTYDFIIYQENLTLQHINANLKVKHVFTYFIHFEYTALQLLKAKAWCMQYINKWAEVAAATTLILEDMR